MFFFLTKKPVAFGVVLGERVVLGKRIFARKLGSMSVSGQPTVTLTFIL